MAKITRLVTFGCSFTYGHGLSDCYHQDGREGSHPSRQAWPFVVAKHFNIKIENKATPGASNKEIFHTLRNFEFRKGDCCIVLWSFVNRHCTIYKNSLDRYGLWVSNDKSNKWFEYFFDEHDACLNTLRHVEHAEFYLRSKKIHNASYFVDRHALIPVLLNEDRYFNSQWLDRAKDGIHPGRLTQQDFASKLINDPIGIKLWLL
jgi:hypothetical protein